MAFLLKFSILKFILIVEIAKWQKKGQLNEKRLLKFLASF